MWEIDKYSKIYLLPYQMPQMSGRRLNFKTKPWKEMIVTSNNIFWTVLKMEVANFLYKWRKDSQDRRWWTITCPICRLQTSNSVEMESLTWVLLTLLFFISIMFPQMDCLWWSPRIQGKRWCNKTIVIDFLRKNSFIHPSTHSPIYLHLSSISVLSCFLLPSPICFWRVWNLKIS